MSCPAFHSADKTLRTERKDRPGQRRPGARRPLLSSALQPHMGLPGGHSRPAPASLMDACCPPTLPGNPLSGRPPATPPQQGWGLPVGRSQTCPCPRALGPAGSSAGSTKGNCTKHRPQALPGPRSTATTRQARSALQRRPGCPSICVATPGELSRDRGHRDKTARGGPLSVHSTCGPRLAPSPRPLLQDSRGDRVLRPGAQTLWVGEHGPAGCRQAHTRSPGPVHTCVHTHACPGRHRPGRGAWGKTGRGHLAGGTVPGEAVRAMWPTSWEKAGPAPAGFPPGRVPASGPTCCMGNHGWSSDHAELTHKGDTGREHAWGQRVRALPAWSHPSAGDPGRREAPCPAPSLRGPGSSARGSDMTGSRHTGQADSLSLCGSPPRSISPTPVSAVKTACHVRGLHGESAWINLLTSQRA